MYTFAPAKVPECTSPKKGRGVSAAISEDGDLISNVCLSSFGNLMTCDFEYYLRSFSL